MDRRWRGLREASKIYNDDVINCTALSQQPPAMCSLFSIPEWTNVFGFFSQDTWATVVCFSCYVRVRGW